MCSARLSTYTRRRAEPHDAFDFRTAYPYRHPTVQIPLFIGLYRSLLNLAKEDKLTESFLWLPSLEGPVSDYTQGISWLKDGWSNGAPPLGWHDTGAYLILPVLLTLSQYASTALLTPKTDDPAQQQSQAILKFLPLMIGWFSLNVPSGLGLYWITNNVATTATTLIIRNSVGTIELAGTAGAAGAAPAAQAPKAQGFGRKYGQVIQTTSDAGTKVTIKPPGAVVASPATADPVSVDTVVAETSSTGETRRRSAAAAHRTDRRMRARPRLPRVSPRVTRSAQRLQEWAMSLPLYLRRSPRRGRGKARDTP